MPSNVPSCNEGVFFVLDLTPPFSVSGKQINKRQKVYPKSTAAKTVKNSLQGPQWEKNKLHHIQRSTRACLHSKASVTPLPHLPQNKTPPPSPLSSSIGTPCAVMSQPYWLSQSSRVCLCTWPLTRMMCLLANFACSALSWPLCSATSSWKVFPVRPRDGTEAGALRPRCPPSSW